MPRGGPVDDHEQPLSDEWVITANPKINPKTGTYDSADFSAVNGGNRVSGEVADGQISANLSNGTAELGVRYDDSGVTGSVGYKFGNDTINMHVGYTSAGTRTGTVSVTFPGGVTASVSTTQTNASYSFSNGWSATYSNSFGGTGSSLSFSSPSSQASGFSMSFGARKSSGGWEVEATVTLKTE